MLKPLCAFYDDLPTELPSAPPESRRNDGHRCVIPEIALEDDGLVGRIYAYLCDKLHRRLVGGLWRGVRPTGWNPSPTAPSITVAFLLRR
jgi:hypothetical protein